MKRVQLIITLLIMLPLISVAQLLNQTDANNLKQGKWEKTYANGITRYVGQFKNNKPYGEFKYFYMSGALKSITNYSSDGVIARTMTFHENSIQMAKGKYINQKKDSVWLYFSEIDGKLISEETYKKGELNGLSKTFYPESGNIAESIEYKNGIKHGELRKYFPEGSIMTKGFYKDDLLDGDFSLYFPDGNIQLKGKYLKGRQIGNWQYFDEEGNELSEDEFKEDDEIEFEQVK